MDPSRPPRRERRAHAVPGRVGSSHRTVQRPAESHVSTREDRVMAKQGQGGGSNSGRSGGGNQQGGSKGGQGGNQGRQSQQGQGQRGRQQGGGSKGGGQQGGNR